MRGGSGRNFEPPAHPPRPDGSGRDGPGLSAGGLRGSEGLGEGSGGDQRGSEGIRGVSGARRGAHQHRDSGRAARPPPAA